MNNVIINKLLDVLHLFLQHIDDKELRQEVMDISDSLESGCITIHTALYWQNLAARKIVRRAFSVTLLHIEVLK